MNIPICLDMIKRLNEFNCLRSPSGDTQGAVYIYSEDDGEVVSQIPLLIL